MELPELQALHELDAARHYGRAAARLGVTQPALSQLVARLERHLGVALFLRDSRGVRPTPAGEILLREARSVLEAADAVRTSARLRARPQDVRVRLAVAGAWGATLLAQTRSSDSRVRVVEASPESMDGLLRDGSADGAVVVGPPVGRDMRCAAVLGGAELRVAVGRSDPLASAGRVRLSDLRERRFVQMPRTVPQATRKFWAPGEAPGPVAHSLEERQLIVASSECIALTVADEEVMFPDEGHVYLPVLDRPRARTWLASSSLAPEGERRLDVLFPGTAPCANDDRWRHDARQHGLAS